MAFLLEPLQAGSLTLKNRLILPPMATSKAGPDGEVSQALLDYYAEISRGGYLSLVIVEHNFVSPDGRAGKNQLSAADDGMVPGLSALAKAIQSNGSKAVVQLNHAGSAAEREITGTEPAGPSAVVNPGKSAVPRELGKDEIADIAAAFQKAAGRHINPVQLA